MYEPGPNNSRPHQGTGHVAEVGADRFHGAVFEQQAVVVPQLSRTSARNTATGTPSPSYRSQSPIRNTPTGANMSTMNRDSTCQVAAQAVEIG